VKTEEVGSNLAEQSGAVLLGSDRVIMFALWRRPHPLRRRWLDWLNLIRPVPFASALAALGAGTLGERG